MTARMEPGFPDPRRGEVWTVDLDPVVGAEIQKTRPAVVVGSDEIGRLPLRLVVPLTGWRPALGSLTWLVRVSPDPWNGLAKESGADAFQVRSVSVRRFARRLGRLSPLAVRRVAAAIALCVDLE